MLRLVLALALLTSCFPRHTPVEPQLAHEIKRSDLRDKPSPFEPLTPQERKSDWGREYVVGVQFARDLDLYRAITTFKRALYLAPKRLTERRLEITYNIAKCYYLGERYEEAIATIEESALCHTDPSFPAYDDLKILLFDSYAHLGCDCTLDVPSDVKMAIAIRQGMLPQELKQDYCRCRKSIATAQTLSAIIPGAGFLYVGQKQTAVTAIVLNGLFIGAAVQLFARGYYTAAAFVTSLEIGWYTGGIYGAGEAAHLYNQRLAERLAQPYADKHRLYAPLLFKYSF